MKIAIIASLLVLSGCLYVISQRNKMINSLPPVENIHSYEVDAMLRNGYHVVSILGTGSMQPYIPEGDGVVAWCLIDQCDYSLLGEGDLVVYDNGKFNVLHQLACLTNDGWIASGLHNKDYDETRVVRSNFRGRVVKTYVLIK